MSMTDMFIFRSDAGHQITGANELTVLFQTVPKQATRRLRNYLLTIWHIKDARSVSYILIIDHKSCNMLSLLHKLTLQKKLQNCVTNNVFLDETVKLNNSNNTKNQA